MIITVNGKENDIQLQTEKFILKGETDCCECWACIAVCSHNAIFKESVGMGSSIPVIDYDLCVKCGLCINICNIKRKTSINNHESYIVVNKDLNQRRLSASGGAFSAIATRVLSENGVVFGAEMKFIENDVIIEHQMIEELTDLYRLLGSKYVLSDCMCAMRQVKEQLMIGKTVLFSGTSCQIDGLYRFLQNDDVTNLYTIDMICHGVPGVNLFREYIQFLEHKYRAKVLRFDFRKKEKGSIKYIETVKLKKNEEIIEIMIPSYKSAYFHMFRNQESYQLSCYSCAYATINKPADITIGDYFEAMNDYPELFLGKNALDKDYGISCLITHTVKGRQLIERCFEQLEIVKVDCERVRLSHSNLQMPSRYTKRDKILKIYKKRGYIGIEAYYAKSRPKHLLKSIEISIWRKIKQLPIFNYRRK